MKLFSVSKLVVLLGTIIAFAPPAAASPEPASSSPSMSGATFAVRLRNLEAAVNEQKEQTRRNRARLALLSDSMPTAGRGNATADLVFHNEVTSDFRLVRAMFRLDGAVRFDKSDDTGTLASQKDIPIFSGALPAGDHALELVLVFQGNGFGVFTYMRGYKLEMKSSHAFTASPNQPVTVIATSVQSGGATTPIQDRLAVRWKVEGARNNAVAVAAASRIDPGDADASILAELRAALSPFGSWVEDATFGTVWVPNASSVGRDFVPFVTGGHWTFEGVTGVDADFAWISDYDWGWAPFHLGRWVFGSSGWSWIPGRAYAPSWVTWRIQNESHGAGSYVGWAPQPPTFVWRNGAAVRIDPPAPRFVYAPANEVFATPLTDHVVVGGQTGAIESRTEIYTPTTGAVARAPSLASMGISVLPARTPVGETSLVRARDFARRGTLVEVVAPTAVAANANPTPNTATATTTPIDAADADPATLADVKTELAPYGTWMEDPTYGTVWTPSPQIVGTGFVPYETGGHWTFERGSDGTEEGGDYVWMSDWSWGWAPFHYGRWVRAATGWVWIPGHTYAPAWVVWRTGDSAVGWAPAPPAFCWKGGVAVRIEAPPPPQFVFVASADVFTPNVSARVLSPARAAEVEARMPTATGVVRGPAPSRIGIRVAVAPRPPANDPGLVRARAGFVHAQVRPNVPVTPTRPATVTIRPTPSAQAAEPIHSAAPPHRPPVTSAPAPTTTTTPRRNPPRPPHR